MEVKSRNLVLVLLIGFVVYSIFVAKIGFRELAGLLGGVSVPFFLLAFGFNFLNLLAFTMSWRAVVLDEVGFYCLFRFILIGIFVNNVTPTLGTGGEPVKAMLLGRECGSRKSRSFASVLTHRMLNMLPFILIAIFGLVATFLEQQNLNYLEIAALSISLAMSVSALFLVVYLYQNKDKLEWLVHSSVRLFSPLVRVFKRGFNPDNYVHEVDRSINAFHEGLSTISSDRWALKKSVLYSFLGWAFDVLAAYSVFLALGYRVPLGVLTIAYTIAMIVGLLPVMPGGLGLVDGAMAFLYISYGVPTSIAMTATILYRIASYWMNTALGAIYLWREIKP